MLVASQRFRGRAFVGGDQSSRLEQFAALYDVAGSLNHVAQSGPEGVGQPVELLEPRRLLEAYEGTAPEPLTPDEHRWLPGALALVPLHWAATAGLVGKDIHQAESAITAAEAWWSRRAELSP